jgi:hypothetical protein
MDHAIDVFLKQRVQIVTIAGGQRLLSPTVGSVITNRPISSWDLSSWDSVVAPLRSHEFAIT